MRDTPPGRHLRRFFLTLGLLAAWRLEAAAGDAGVFEFESLNRSHDRLAADIAPIESGPVKVQLSSPQHVLSLLSNRLVLRPLGQGVYDLALQLEFAGKGLLIADIDLGGSKSRFEDQLTVPSQKRTVVAKVRVGRSPSGYLITPLELPPNFEVAIESRLGGQLVSVCKGLAAFGLLPISCEDLARSVSLVSVPMPAPGETYVLEHERLNTSERATLDAFLTRTGAALAPAKAER